MNLFGNVSSAVRALFSGRGGGGSYYAQRAIQIPSARFDWLAEAGDFRQNPVVALGLDWIIRNCMSVPIKLYVKTRLGEEVELEGHPILDILKTPNPTTDFHQFCSILITDILTWGTAFSLIVDNNGGTPGELYWIDARYVGPDFPVDGSKYLNSWKYIPAGTGRPQVYDPSQVIEFRKGTDSWNDRIGYTPLMGCTREIALVNLLAGYTASILKNAGVTNMVVMPTGENIFNDEQTDKLRTTIAQNIGMDKQGSALVVKAPVEMTNLTTSPKDMLLQEVDMHAVARITSAMGLSPMVLGLPDPGKTYSNYREAQRAAWINAIIPMHDLLTTSLTRRLLSLYDPSGRLCLKWDYSNVEALAEDQKAQADRAALLYDKGILTKNEARKICGFEPVEDGEDFKGSASPMGMNNGDFNAIEADAENAAA